MSTLEQNLLSKYIKMINLNNFINVTGNTIINGSLSITSSLNVSGNTNLNNISIQSNLNISNNSILNNTSICSNLIINNNVYNANNITLLNNLTISGYSILNNINANNSYIFNSTSFLSKLNINGQSNINNISTNLITSNIININGININIGNPNSIINMNGTSNFVMTQQLMLTDKIFTLNYNYTTNSGLDNGNLCGINILGISSNGFIRTSLDASRFEIKVPNSITTNYILTLDLNNNLNISGKSLFQNSNNINSSLCVSGTANLNNIIASAQVNYNKNNLYINGLIINNTCNVSNNSQLYSSNLNNCYINNSIFNNISTINSVLNCTMPAIFNSNLYLNKLFVSNFSLLNNTVSNNSNLNVSGNTIINGALTTFSLINNKSIIIGNISIKSNLNANLTNINNNLSINSNLNISGNYIACGNITLLSSIPSDNLNIIGQVISNVPEYQTNLLAAQNGIPLWGFYRTGGILKIRLEIIPPVISLLGKATLSISIGSSYTDPGVLASDSIDGILTPYLFSIYNNNNSELSNLNVPITTNTLIPIDTSTQNIFTFVYQVTNSVGNYSQINRIVNIY
uniref:Uncharacterized protein n=1 Tax=viral metagenome TaxID=1070528 RepID=A0A6C0ED46_9ZZZZ